MGRNATELPLVLAIVVLAGCASHRQVTPTDIPEPWFQSIRAVSGASGESCVLLGKAEAKLRGADAVPPIPPEDYRTLRRVAFTDFERQVLAGGGNAVRAFQIEESAMQGPQFLLDSISLSGEIVRCSIDGSLNAAPADAEHRT